MQKLKNALFQYAELFLSGVTVSVIFIVGFALKPETPIGFRHSLVLTAAAAAVLQLLCILSVWNRRRRLKFQIIAAARHTIHVQAENTISIDMIRSKDPELATASDEEKHWYRHGYERGVKDYEFTLDQLIEPVIRATKEFYAPPGMDTTV